VSTGTTVVGARVFDGREVQPETSVRFVGGSDYLKIIYKPGDGRLFTLPSLELASVRALARAAHDRWLVAVVHVTSVAAFAGVVDSGAAVLTHLPVDRLLEAAISTLPTREIPASVQSLLCFWVYVVATARLSDIVLRGDTVGLSSVHKHWSSS